MRGAEGAVRGRPFISGGMGSPASRGKIRAPDNLTPGADSTLTIRR
jgi:hypothetical protein